MAQRISKKQIVTATASLTFGSGWSAIAGHPVSAVRVGNIVFLRGVITKNAAWVATTEVAATIPAGFRPSTNMGEDNIIYNTANNATAQPSTLNVYTTAPTSGNAGQIRPRIAGASGGWIALNGISYEVEP